MQANPQFDPDLPNASAVMASLCCVASQYASQPSLELAKLASSWAHTLTAPHYAESKLIVEVAKRLVRQWDEVLDEALSEQNEILRNLMPSSPYLQ
ncbi:MAG: hypothetical protein U1E13_14485 [Methylophilaceae bacterium]|nr:hypothetical protein [Methylophilaceae bacterium]